MGQSDAPAGLQAHRLVVFKIAPGRPHTAFGA